ncbi:hypothetical protein D187_009361 [Cystobacter fuscus DSM 2262]|uniref:Uncharacterized protein n=1 Tax=Cystobacter fuscus (strain ATCC 25194 / DSM 2262 / NBRC 100088 / M29) TaxID=1242864 RepID=S9NWS1_CYSF2|nr:hypothetical protein D187_009361 [Cystobacter fuscus DSM 2262]
MKFPFCSAKKSSVRNDSSLPMRVPIVMAPRHTRLTYAPVLPSLV